MKVWYPLEDFNDKFEAKWEKLMKNLSINKLWQKALKMYKIE